MSVTPKVTAPIPHSLTYIHRLISSIQVKIWHLKLTWPKLNSWSSYLNLINLQYSLTKLKTTSFFLVLRPQTQESYVTLLSLSCPISNNLRNPLGSTFKIYRDYPLLITATAITLFHLIIKWCLASTLALLKWILNRAATMTLLISVSCVTPLLKTLEWLSVSLRVKAQVFKMACKSKHHLVSLILFIYLTLLSPALTWLQVHSPVVVLWSY